MNIPLFLIEKTDSTMNEIKKEKYSSYYNVAVVANTQTKGKGRRKNVWISSKGNLFLSIRLKNKIEMNHYLTAYMIGIVVYDTLKLYLKKNTNMIIKWPNDILINNKKVSGTLIEFLSSGNKITDVIIGIGINLHTSPFILKNVATHLSKYSNLKFQSMDIIKAIMLGVNYWIKILSNNNKIIIKEWMKRSTQINTTIKFYYDNKLCEGLYKGINEDGSIKVIMNNKECNFFNLDSL